MDFIPDDVNGWKEDSNQAGIADVLWEADGGFAKDARLHKLFDHGAFDEALLPTRGTFFKGFAGAAKICDDGCVLYSGEDVVQVVDAINEDIDDLFSRRAVADFSEFVGAGCFFFVHEIQTLLDAAELVAVEIIGVAGGDDFHACIVTALRAVKAVIHSGFMEGRLVGGSDKDNEALHWTVRSALAGGAVVCFFLTVWLALNDKAAAGALMAGLFIALVLMSYLPAMESFKAFGLEAKMRARLTEAEAILEQLREVITVFGKISYHNFGVASRMMHPVREKQVLADEVDKLLIQMKVNKADHAAMKEQYLHFLLYDLNAALHRIVERNVDSNARDLLSKANAAKSDPARAVEAAALTEQREALMNHRKRLGVDFPEYGFLQWCRESVPRKELLPEDDYLILRDLAERVGRAGETSRAEGRLVEDGAAVIEEHHEGGTDGFYVRLFKRGP